MWIYKYISGWLLIPLFWLGYSNLLSQEQTFFDNISTESGLSSQKVNQVIQDRFGFLWFASQNGLNKYNGYSITVYKSDLSDTTSLSHNNLSSIAESGNYIWVGTYGGGLNRFNRGKVFKHYRHNPNDSSSISDDYIYSICFDKDGTLWIATKSGLSKFLPEIGKFQNFYKDIPIYRIAEDNNSNLYLSTADGFFIFNKVNNTSKKIKLPPTDFLYSPFPILFDSNNRIWIGTNKGLKKFIPYTEQIVSWIDENNIMPELNNVPIDCLFEDSNNNIWVGTFRAGLFEINMKQNSVKKHLKNEYDINSISHSSVGSLFEDRSKNLWITTPSGGLNKLNLKEKKFNHYYHVPFAKNSLSNNTVLSFYEDEEDNLWVGTDYDITVYNKDKSKCRKIVLPGNSKHNSYISILAINKGFKDEIWIGTRLLGLQIYNTKLKRFIDITKNSLFPPNIHNAWIRKIIHDSNGNIWITSDKSLFCYRKDLNKFIQYNTQNSNLNDEATVPIYEDVEGYIWVGTKKGGVNKLDLATNTFTNYSYINNDTTSLTSNYVVSLTGDDKYIWAGTLNGLSRIDRKTGKIYQITEKKGLIDDCINGILIDDAGDLWMSTNYGISHYSDNVNLIRNYDRLDGLQDNKFNGLSYYKSKSGVMYFGGTHGFNSFVPEKVKDNKFIPQIVLTSFKVLYTGKTSEYDLSHLNEIELNYDENNFQFEFASLDYTIPQKNLYQYKLEGFDHDWSHASNSRIASYTNLDAGEYIFKVIGSNNDNYWNKKGASVKVVISPAFWNTWWFDALIASLLLLIIWTAYKLRVKGLEKQRLMLEGLNKKLFNEVQEHKKTAVQLIEAKEKAEHADNLKSEFLAQISHEIRSPINIISNYITLMKDDLSGQISEILQLSFNAIDKANARITRSIDMIINMSELQLGTYEPVLDKLNLRTDVLNDIIIEYNPSAKKKNIDISFSSNVEEPLIIGDRYSITQIFANLIDNAIKYTNSGEIKIKIENHENDKLKALIHDTGIGISTEYIPNIFNPFSQEERGYTRRFEGNGLGLALVKKYCELNKAQVSVESEKGIGTTFTIVLSKYGKN